MVLGVARSKPIRSTLVGHAAMLRMLRTSGDNMGEIRTVTATTLSVGTVRALAPLIREKAEAIESERRLAEPVVRALVEAGVFKLLVPRALGGGETDPVTVC